jgi:hypothetical protein
MKILFIGDPRNQDYQQDILFHGLRTLFGADVVDLQPLWFMYRDGIAERGVDPAALYGRGFTLYGLLDGMGEIDRTDIPAKIKARAFDLVIYGSVRRHHPLLLDVFEAYGDRVVFVDGEDDTHLNHAFLHRGAYFKRELTVSMPGVLPIGFGIPEEKILDSRPTKERTIAHITPADRSTYIYDTEDGYYGDYARSRFGVTMKKSGWDCLRHYEIMMNQCLPLFRDLPQCPAMTMAHFPRFEVQSATNLLDQEGEAFFSTSRGEQVYDRLLARVMTELRGKMTTKAVARSLVDRAERLFES